MAEREGLQDIWSGHRRDARPCTGAQALSRPVMPVSPDSHRAALSDTGA